VHLDTEYVAVQHDQIVRFLYLFANGFHMVFIALQQTEGVLLWALYRDEQVGAQSKVVPCLV
jgi:hypothetical protein